MENKSGDNFIYPEKNIQNFNSSTGMHSPFFTNTTGHSGTNKNIKGKFIFRIILASVVLITSIIIVTFFPSVLGVMHNGSKFVQYDKFIWPVVMQDPDVFSENNPPSNELLLDSSIWKAASEKTKDSCNYDSRGRVILLAEEVKAACSVLFGDKYNISPKSITANNKFYEYSPEENLFYVDAVSYDQCFIPRTVGLTQYEDLIILKVDYINIEENTELNDRYSKNYKSPKHMEYFLKKRTDNGDFYISEIKEITHYH